MGSQRVRHDWATELNWTVTLVHLRKLYRAVTLIHCFKFLHTPPTSMMPWLRFNLSETTSAQPLWGGGQTQQKPNSAKSPMVEAECKENPVQEKWQEAQHAGNQDSKNKLSRKLTWLSLRFQKTSNWGRSSLPLWHVANKILIPLQSLVPFSLNTLWTG